MCTVVNVMQRSKDAARAALRWGIDVLRGYTRIADGREGLLSLFDFARRADDPTVALNYADAALDVLDTLAKQRTGGGGLGAGARLALSSAEWLDLRLEAEEVRSGALTRQAQKRART